MLNGWIGMGPGRGRLKVELGHPFPEVMEDSFYEDTPDHRILVVAQYMKENNPDRRVILITKDVNLRIKSKALSIEAQDYMNDKVRDESIVSLSKGVIRMNRVTPQTMAKLYQTPEGLSAKDIKLKGAHNNQYYVLKNKDGSALARYEAAKKRLVPVPNHRLTA